MSIYARMPDELGKIFDCSDFPPQVRDDLGEAADLSEGVHIAKCVENTLSEAAEAGDTDAIPTDKQIDDLAGSKRAFSKRIRFSRP